MQNMQFMMLYKWFHAVRAAQSVTVHQIGKIITIPKPKYISILNIQKTNK